MVLRDKHRSSAPQEATMAASDQPLKKKQRIDAPDLDADCDIISPSELLIAENSPDSGTMSEDAVDCSIAARNLQINPEINESTDLGAAKTIGSADSFDVNLVCDSGLLTYILQLQERLMAQCLCGTDERRLHSLMAEAPKLVNWPTEKILQYLSTLQLFLDLYLRQNVPGRLCTAVKSGGDALIRYEHSTQWLDAVLRLADNRSPYVTFLASRVISSFLILAKDNIDHNWLQRVVENVYLFDTFDHVTVQKINFSLDVIKRIIEWKDMDQHPLEDSAYINTSNPIPSNGAGVGPSPSEPSSSGCSASSITHNHPCRESLNSAFSHLNTHNLQSSRSILAVNVSDSDDDDDIESTRESPIAPELREESVTPPPPFMQSEEQTCVTVSDNVIPAGICQTVLLTDSESFDTSHIKCLTIKALEHHWPILVKNVKLLLTRYLNLTNAENCILTFLSLWENTISIKANLSVIDTKPFYADLQSFVELLRSTELPPLIYTQLLGLYNEVLCYGSTLALQDLLPDETCTLAHAIVRFVKDFRLLNEIHVRNSQAGFGFVGLESQVLTSYNFVPQNRSLVDSNYGENESEPYVEPYRDDYSARFTPRNDRTMLQKLTLLILKSVAVTVKEMRCDSSDSSIDSTDYNAIQDMQMVERSIRDVLKKLDVFMKDALEFHPESPFTKVLVHLFCEQDDYLIESMVCTLDITVGIVYRNSVYPDLIPMLNPILTFVEFLQIVAYDSDVLLDYLVSNETCFLLYLLRFLKYVRRNWSKFLEACQQTGSRGVDGMMSVLIRLRLQISRLVSKSLFPYNISPVLRLLEVCESLYEGNELS